MKKLFMLVLSALLSFNLFFAVGGAWGEVHAEEPLMGEAATIDPYAFIEGMTDDVRRDFRLRSAYKVAYGTVYKFAQVYEEKEVYGNEIVVTANNNGKVTVLGDYIDVPRLAKNISLLEAESIAKERFGGDVITSEVKVFAYDNKPTLCYEITLDGVKAFVSAETGEILLSAPVNNYVQMPQTDAFGSDVTIDVTYDSMSGVYQLADFVRNIYVMDANNKTDVGNANLYSDKNGAFEPIAVSSYMNVVKAYDFYTDADNIGVSLRGINGMNDGIADNYLNGNHSQKKEIPIFIYMHYGENYENAACTYESDSSMAVLYVGDGKANGTIYQPGKSLDILAHEYQHAVTTATANLEYVNDSGALSEAFSDIFGALVEGRDPSDSKFWTIGEDVAVSPRTEVRSMIGGTQMQRYAMKDKFYCPFKRHSSGDHTEWCDYGGVHFNSTIVTNMQYKLYQKMPEFFTRGNIGKLWYSTLCTLTANATFEDFAAQFLQAAINLEFPKNVCATIKETLIEEGFMEEETTFTVTFLDEADNVLSELTVAEGCAISLSECPVPPEKPSDERYTYEFAGWKLPEIVTGNITLKAEYKEVLRAYEICLVNMDGKIIEYKSGAYGDELDTSDFPMPNPPGEDYVFDDWYIGKDYSEKADGFVINGDVRVYAKWIKEESDGTGCAGCGSIALGGFGGGGLAMLLLVFPILFLPRKKVGTYLK